MQRVISGVVLAAAALAAILFLPYPALRVLLCVVAGVAAHEFMKITGAAPSLAAATVVVCWFVSGSAFFGVSAVIAFTLVQVVLAVLWRGTPIDKATVGAFAHVYIAVPLGLLGQIHAGRGWKATVYLIASIVVSDSMQYYTGRAFGRHPLAPAISPKKTIEGAIGGLVFGTAFIAIAGWYLFALTPSGTIPFGVTVVVAGILGDLFESRLKRAASIKDSSSLIPGHGGVLDRIDALLFAAPVFYVYFTN